MLLTNVSPEMTAAEEAGEYVSRRPHATNPIQNDQWAIIGASPTLQAVLSDVDCVAPTSAPVLIVGETGTGKDLLARRVHQQSDRSARPWIRVDCTTLTPNLIESELFGHVKGAFTGATGQRVGRVELAHGGTLFLDEIGELPTELQSKLLRLVQHQEFEPVGSSRTSTVDVRIVAATNRDLRTEMETGRFRADLYYRLAAFPIFVPALRDRLDDLPSLVEYLLCRQLKEMHRPPARVPPGVIAALQQHNWPGNIRELRSVVERACIRSTGRCLMAQDFDHRPPRNFLPKMSSNRDAAPRGRTMREVECEHFRAMLALSGGIIEGRRGAAAMLGLSPSTLRFRLRRLGIASAAFRNTGNEIV